MEILAEQWCPVLKDVVEIVIRGDLYGNLAKGRVAVCYAYTSGVCKELHSSFCLVGREILTQAKLVGE